MENNEAEKKKERKIPESECRLRELSDSNKCINICITRVPEGEEKEKGQKIYLRK